MNNAHLFDTTEYESWAQRQALIGAERYLIEKYVLPAPRGKAILEVGTGNGRILSAIAGQGFHDCTGIDLAGRLLAAARRAARRNGREFLNYRRMDASRLEFADASIDIAVALQQVFCMITEPSARQAALRECHRVLRPGGLLIASFLHFEGRAYNGCASLCALPFKIAKGDFRYLRRQYLPWLRLGGRPNFAFILRRQPYVYWYRTDELRASLAETGFAVVELTTARMLRTGSAGFLPGGMLYLAAQKP